MTNILEAIVNIVNNPNFDVKTFYIGSNRVNTVGEALESFVKDAFANALTAMPVEERMALYSDSFSWLGNQNHPPDIMIKNGDAIEVKKSEKSNSEIPLNSSYPKSNILASSNMITHDCKSCEDWKEKDLIYCIGHVSKEKIKSIWMVYGNIYAAKRDVYQKISDTIIGGINEIPNVELAETNELGRVNRVDPLGITNLRIRGMWQIRNPRKVFDYLHTQTGKTFELVAIIPLTKYNTFPSDSRISIEKLVQSKIFMKNVKVKDPNNPAILIDSKLISFII